MINRKVLCILSVYQSNCRSVTHSYCLGTECSSAMEGRFGGVGERSRAACPGNGFIDITFASPAVRFFGGLPIYP